jgi:hypothetical protein
MKPTNEQLLDVIRCCELLMKYEPNISDSESRRAEKQHGLRLSELAVSFAYHTAEYIERTK